MLESVEANLIADVLWLPVGWLILRLGRRVLRELREELAQVTADQTREIKAHITAAPTPAPHE